MNKQELQNGINKTKEHLANMEKMLEECGCEYERWKPQKGEIYWYVDGDCCINNLIFTNDDFDNSKTGAYNCFQTREQAEAEAEKILVRRMLEEIARRLNKGERIDWTKHNSKYYLYYNHYDKVVKLETGNGFQYQGTVYCLAPNFKDVAIQEIGEERLKKYLRGE